MQYYTKFYVYIHRFSNGTLYIGKGCGNRAFQFSKKRHNIYWDRLLIKYGNPRVKILKSNMKEKDSLLFEMSIIERLKGKNKVLCNRTEGGDGCVGMYVSDATKEKLSKMNKGKNNNMYGKTHSDEAKESISLKNKGRFVGSKSARYKTDIFDFVNADGIKFKGTQWEFSKSLDLNQSAVSMLCSKRIDSFHGWRLKETDISDTGRRGKRHGRYDNTKFNFIHDSGIEEYCTKFELNEKYELPNYSNLSSLCNNKIPSYKGWRLNQALN